MFFDEETTDDDTRIVYGDLVVVVDSDSLPLISGAVLDYTDGLQGAGFHVTTPTATRTCGCGNSFC